MFTSTPTTKNPTATTTSSSTKTTVLHPKQKAAKEAINILEEISILLNTNLTRTQLSLCVSMIENGVNPDALAVVVKELRGQKQKLESGRKDTEGEERDRESSASASG